MGPFDRFEIIRADWFGRLRDAVARHAIEAHILRLENGNFGDAKAVGDGLSELRVHVGPGYRVYFTQHGCRVVVLLCAGDKSTQSKDIALARRIAARFREL